MPNLYIAADTKFDPLSFDEMAKPYMMYKQEFDKQQEALGELDAKASVWEGMANKETDPLTYAKYKAYSDNLRQAATSLALNGLNGGSKAALMALKGDYSSRIVPLENAYTRKQKLAEEQRQGRAKGMIYDYDAQSTSLDDFLMGKRDYQSIDINALYSKAAAAFSNLSKVLEDYGEGKDIDSYTKTFIQQYGISKENLANFMDKARNGNLDLNDGAMAAIFNSLYNGTGVRGWNNETANNQVINTILQGASSALGQANVSTMENFGNRQMLQHQIHEMEADAQAQRDINKALQQRRIDAGLMDGVLGIGTPSPNAEPEYTSQYFTTARDREEDSAFKGDEDNKGMAGYMYGKVDEKTGKKNYFINAEGQKVIDDAKKEAENYLKNSILGFAMYYQTATKRATPGANPEIAQKKAEDLTVSNMANTLKISKKQAQDLFDDNRGIFILGEGKYSLEGEKLSTLAEKYPTFKKRLSKNNATNWLMMNNMLDADISYKGQRKIQDALNYSFRRSVANEETRKHDATRTTIHFKSYTDNANKEAAWNYLNNMSTDGTIQTYKLDPETGRLKVSTREPLPLDSNKMNMQIGVYEGGSFLKLTTTDNKGKPQDLLVPLSTQSASGELSNSAVSIGNDATAMRREYLNYVQDQALRGVSAQETINVINRYKNEALAAKQVYGNEQAVDYYIQSIPKEIRGAVRAAVEGFDNEETYINSNIGNINSAFKAAEGILVPSKVDQQQTKPTETRSI